jgi:hypothetical protein
MYHKNQQKQEDLISSRSNADSGVIQLWLTYRRRHDSSVLKLASGKTR